MIENQYSLLTFGIPVDVLPLTDNTTTTSGERNKGSSRSTATGPSKNKSSLPSSSWRKDKHLQWVKRRVIKESYLRLRGEFRGIDLPRHGDILLGRGLTYHQHPGNIQFRTTLTSLLDVYGQANRAGKQELYKTIVEDTKRTSRFLKRDGDAGWWIETSDEEAREKVSSSFRTVKKTVPAAATVAKSAGPVDDNQEEVVLLLPATVLPASPVTTFASARRIQQVITLSPGGEREDQYVVLRSHGGANRWFSSEKERAADGEERKQYGCD